MDTVTRRGYGTAAICGFAMVFGLREVLRMLTGVAPYSGTNVVQVIAMHLNAPVPSLTAAHPDGVYPPGLDQMVSRLLAKNPDERYLNSAELIEVITGLEQGQVAASASSKGITPARVLGGLVAAAVVAAAGTKTCPAVAEYPEEADGAVGEAGVSCPC